MKYNITDPEFSFPAMNITLTQKLFLVLIAIIIIYLMVIDLREEEKNI